MPTLRAGRPCLGSDCASDRSSTPCVRGGVRLEALAEAGGTRLGRLGPTSKAAASAATGAGDSKSAVVHRAASNRRAGRDRAAGASRRAGGSRCAQQGRPRARYDGERREVAWRGRRHGGSNPCPAIPFSSTRAPSRPRARTRSASPACTMSGSGREPVRLRAPSGRRVLLGKIEFGPVMRAREQTPQGSRPGRSFAKPTRATLFRNEGAYVIPMRRAWVGTPRYGAQTSSLRPVPTHPEKPRRDPSKCCSSGKRSSAPRLERVGGPPRTATRLGPSVDRPLGSAFAVVSIMSTATTKHGSPKKSPSGRPLAPRNESAHGRSDSGEAFLPDPNESRSQMHRNDELAERLGEACIQAATSGETAFYSDDFNPGTTDEWPFVRMHR
jgi:hypothetical protein